jgi:hypothetical protein
MLASPQLLEVFQGQVLQRVPTPLHLLPLL